jgi:acid phosphatase (class A)
MPVREVELAWCSFKKRAEVLMSMLRNALIILICLSFGSALAADPFCPDAAVRVSVLLMPPPQRDSAQTKAELQELLHLQRSRTPEQVKHAKDDDHRTVERFLDGTGITVDQLSPEARHLFDCIANSVREAVHEAKTSFARTRPYRVEGNKLHVLKTLSDQDSSSYPSGHATYGAAVGLVLAEIFPEKKDAIDKRIETYGYSRLVSGAHFRSDVYAGQVAGAAIAASLLSNEAFREELKNVRVELRRAAGMTP